MIWVKSVGFGFAAAIVFAFCASVAAAIIMSRVFRSGQAFWNPFFVLRHPATWLLLAVTFTLGFLWEYRRLIH